MPSAFEFGLALTQGRVADDDAPEGSYVFELGHAGGRTNADIAVGDFSEVSQTITVGSNEIVARVTVRVIEPSDDGTTVAWDLIGSIGGVPFFARRLTNLGRSLVFEDLAVSLAGAGGPTPLTFRLEAVTP